MSELASEKVPTVGGPDEVHAFGHWYAGKVVKATAVRLSIEYTSGTGVTRIKAVPATPKELVTHRSGFVTGGKLWRLPGEKPAPGEPGPKIRGGRRRRYVRWA